MQDVVPPGPKPFSCFIPAKGINSKYGESLSRIRFNFSEFKDFPLCLAFISAPGDPALLDNFKNPFNFLTSFNIAFLLFLKEALLLFIVDLNFFI